MKKILYIIALCALFASCEKPVEPIVDQELALTVSADSIICEPQMGDLTALQLAWTAGTNHGTGSAISYTLDMSIDGTSDQPVQFVIGRTSDRTLLLSHIQLSDTLCKYFPKMEEKRFYTFTLRMRALVQMTKEEQVSEPVKVVIARYPSVLVLLLQADTVPSFPSLTDRIAWQMCWTSADSHGVEQEIAYTIDIDKDSAFAAGVHYPIDSAAHRTLELTHAELSSLLAQSFPDMSENRFYTLYTRVRAKIGQSGEEQFSYAVPVQICRYAKEVSPLYLVGDATPNGWDKDNATPTLMDEADPNKHLWQGYLKHGEFKFLASKIDWFPCYVRNYDYPAQMVRRENDNDGYYDFKWLVPASGEYRIEADTKQMTIAIIPLDGVHLYLIGDATDADWQRENAVKMTRDDKNRNLYTWQGNLKRGEFKLLVSTEDWLPCYVRNSDDASKMVYRESDEAYEDLKWAIQTAGEYRITANTETLAMTIEFLTQEEHSHIYMIGDATPNGWNWDNITELDHPQAHVFTYEGTLKVGEIKFPTEIKTDWSGTMIYAPRPDCAPVLEDEYDEHAGSPDNKWKIPAEGNWYIKIDTQNKTISFKQL